MCSRNIFYTLPHYLEVFQAPVRGSAEARLKQIKQPSIVETFRSYSLIKGSTIYPIHSKAMVFERILVLPFCPPELLVVVTQYAC